MERFVKEFAHYKERGIDVVERITPSEDVKRACKDARDKIFRIVSAREREQITVDEAMREIANVSI